MMTNNYIFHFKTDISNVNIPTKLNNPFGLEIGEIAKLAAQEFQDFIRLESKNWEYDFKTRPGKMFGVLVVQKQDGSYGYLGTASGKVDGYKTCDKFVPSVFDDSSDDCFINKGLRKVTKIGDKIKITSNPKEIIALKKHRSETSFALQQKLFENYIFSNNLGEEQNILQIFENSTHGNPPAASGECAAPKLFQYAFNYQLKPIAIAEFWWGNYIKNKEKEHKNYYPACKNKCRPILEFMLNDTELFNSVIIK